MMMKKLLAIILSLVMVMSFVPSFSLTALAAEDLRDTVTGVTLTDSDGDGHYEISSADELYAFANLVNSGNTAINGELTADILVNTDLLASDGSLNTGTFEEWTPIGCYNNAPYSGIFDGNNKVISGIFVNQYSQKQGAPVAYGLFGSTDNAKIKNIILKDSFVGGYDRVGGIAGVLWGDDAEMSNCVSYATIKGFQNIGGIVGRVGYADVINCYNYGLVTGSNNMGGFAGSIELSTTVSYCGNEGNIVWITGSHGGMGGFVGVISGGAVIENCYNAGNLTYEVPNNYMYEDPVGGFTSTVYEATIRNCYTSGVITVEEATNRVGGFSSTINTTNVVVENCYYNMETVTRNGVNITRAYYSNTSFNSETKPLTTAQFESGEACYKLNNFNSTGNGWYQSIGTDDYPKHSGSVVYFDATEEDAYTNTAVDNDATTYDVTIAEVEGGMVLTTKHCASEGSVVTLIAKPEINFKLSAITYTDADNNTVTITDNKFIMPASSVTVVATFERDFPKTGKIGTNVNYSLEADGTLTVYAETVGKTASMAPFRVAAYKDMVKKAIIGPGITELKDSAFTYCTNLEQVDIIDSSVKYIRASVFNGLSDLTTFNYWGETLPVQVVPNALTGTGVTVVNVPENFASTATFGNIPLSKTLPAIYLTATPTAGGSVTSSHFSGPEGTEITLTATPVEGYKLKSLAVVTADNDTLTVNNGVFVMPNESVYVTATFVEDRSVTLDGVETDTDGYIVLGIDNNDGTYSLPENVVGYYFDEDFVDAGKYAVVGGEVINTVDFNVTMVNGAQVRYGGGLDENGKVMAGNGLRFLAQVDRSEFDAEGYGMKITAEGSSEEEIVNAEKWQDDTTYSVAITDMAESNYIRKFTATPFAKVKYTDGSEKTIYGTETVTRSIYQVAAGLLKDETQTAYGLSDVLNAYANQTGIRLVVKDGELKANTNYTQSGSYKLTEDELHFEVSDAEYDAAGNKYSVILTAVGNAEIITDNDFWYEYIRINNNNSLVKDKITVERVEGSDKAVKVTFAADGLIERPSDSNDNTTPDNAGDDFDGETEGFN